MHANNHSGVELSTTMNEELSQQGQISSKRERILAAASQLFAQQDFHAVSVDDVAKLAEIAKGTLYNYFESKEALYLSIIETRMENLIAQLRHRLEEQHDPLEDLRRFLIHLYRFMTKYPEFFLVWKKEEHTKRLMSNSRCIEMRKELEQMLQKILSRGVKEHQLRPIPIQLVTDMLFGIVDAVVARALRMSLSTDEQKAESNDIFEFVIRGLKAQ